MSRFSEEMNDPQDRLGHCRRRILHAFGLPASLHVSSPPRGTPFADGSESNFLRGPAHPPVRVHSARGLRLLGCPPQRHAPRHVDSAGDLHSERHRFHSLLHPARSSSAALFEVRCECQLRTSLLSGLRNSSFPHLPFMPAAGAAGLAPLRSLRHSVVKVGLFISLPNSESPTRP